MSHKRQRQRWDKRKWDESDFALQAQDMPVDDAKPLQVVDGRVLTDPPPNRNIKIGKEVAKHPICLHGKLLSHPCPTCDYEAPRLTKLQEAAER